MRNRQAGTSLVEILITMVLVAVGLLGLAGLQVATVQNSNSATERFEASTLAANILERMRANRVRALAGEYNDGGAPGDIASNDLDEWTQALGVLPDGVGSINVQAGVATIVVGWSDASNDNVDDGNADTPEMSVVLRTNL